MKHKTTPNRDKIAVRGFSSKKIPREPSFLPNINPHTARWASRGIWHSISSEYKQSLNDSVVII